MNGLFYFSISYILLSLLSKKSTSSKSPKVKSNGSFLLVLELDDGNSSGDNFLVDDLGFESKGFNKSKFLANFWKLISGDLNE